MFSIRSVIDGRFNWDAYKATKTTSVAISIITLGINAIRNGLPPAPTTAASMTTSEIISVGRQQVAKAVMT